MMTSAYPVVTIIGILVAALTIASGLIWLERRLLALWQDRYGPNRVGPFGLLQVLADMIKIFFKEDWTPPFADKEVFIIAPAVIVITVLMSFAVLPIAPGIVVADLNIGLLFILAMSSLGVYSVVLAGWSSDNKYALIGAFRAAAQMLSYEVFMGLSLMGVVLLAGSFDLVQIVEAQRHIWFIIPQFLAHLGYLIVAFEAGGSMAGSAVAFYLVAYFATMLGAFGVVTVLSTPGNDLGDLASYRGLFWRRPIIASVFTVMLLSLAGIPLTAGFIGKFYVIAAGASVSMWVLVFTLVVTSAIGLFYYLRIIVALYSRVEEPVAEVFISGRPAPHPLTWALGALTAVVIAIGCYPNLVLHLIQVMIAGTG
jgi:hypothetical protein